MFLFCYFSGQICFCLVNLEPMSYAVELRKVPKREMLAAITEMIRKGVIPKQNQIYREKLETVWFHLPQAGKASIKIDLSERPSAKALQDILCNTLKYSTYPLRNHQGSALEEEQDIFSEKILYKRILYNKIFNQLDYHPVFCFKNLKFLIFEIFFFISFSNFPFSLMYLPYDGGLLKWKAFCENYFFILSSGILADFLFVNIQPNCFHFTIKFKSLKSTVHLFTHFFLFFFLSFFPSFFLSFFLYLFICLFVCLFVYLFIDVFMYLFIYLFVCLFVCLFIFLFIYVFIYLFIYLFNGLSIYFE